MNISNKSYKSSENIVLKQLDFTINAGEFVAIIGPSGCGKSTLLNMLGGLEDSVNQQILCNGKPIQQHNTHRLGYIFQQQRLMPWLTISENLALVLDNTKNHLIEPILEQVGLGGKGGYFPRQLSGGMQRRVSIARAFIIEPELLFLDESFNSIDQPTAARLRLLLLELWQENHPTVVFVTHDLREAVYMADRIIFLSDSPGQIIHQIKVDLPRPRNEFGSKELEWQAQLMAEYPSLLSGSTF